MHRPHHVVLSGASARPQAYPQPLCATCGAWARCEARGAAEPSYPACRVPLRRVRLDRVQALFDAWRELDGVTAPEARAQERALLATFARDRERFSDIFEASFSIAAPGAELAHHVERASVVEHAYRFSYAFPGFRAEIAPAGGSRTSAHSAAAALAMMAPFGGSVAAAVRRLLRAATEPAVEQPLVGIAWDRAGAPRHKVYLQFRDGAGGAAAALAERVLGIDGLAERVLGIDGLARSGAGARLHMLGVDLGAGGLTGAKLYVLHPSAGAGDGAFGAALAAALGPISRGRAVRHALAIHRITQASAAGTLPPPSDADLSLADNDLVWDDVARAPQAADLLGRSRVAAALFSRFALGVRRLSIGLGAHRRLTVYYGLREVEEP